MKREKMKFALWGAVMLCLFSCGNEHDTVLYAVKEMESRPMALHLDRMQCKYRGRDTLCLDSVMPKLRLVSNIPFIFNTFLLEGIHKTNACKSPKNLTTRPTRTWSLPTILPYHWNLPFIPLTIQYWHASKAHATPTSARSNYPIIINWRLIVSQRLNIGQQQIALMPLRYREVTNRARYTE